MAFKTGDISYWRGKKLSKEHRRKLSESHKGYKMPEEQRKKLSRSVKENPPSTVFKKGSVPWNKGKPRPDMIGNTFAKRKHSLVERVAKSKRSMGKKNINWKGGKCKETQLIRNCLEAKLWREAVYKRDDWVCQKCGERGGKLTPHHIKNFADYPDLRFAVDNGVTLCKKCHDRFHKKYGKSKTNATQLKEFMK